MRLRYLSRYLLILPMVALILIGGCGKDSERKPPSSGSTKPKSPIASRPLRDNSVRDSLLGQVITLLQEAPLTPGGPNVAIAASSLNQYFRQSDPDNFLLTQEERDFIKPLFFALGDRIEAEEKVAAAEQNRPSMFNRSFFYMTNMEGKRFDINSARHIEDCLLYHNVASRVARGGSKLDQTRRLFDWTVNHVQLIPEGTAVPAIPPGSPGFSDRIKHVQSRPYDILVRGLATEIPGDLLWAERSWVFASLCRQIGVDVGMLAYPVEGRLEPYAWLTAALIDGTAYLFDLRTATPILNVEGTMPATFQEAATIPEILDRISVPGSGMETTAADLNEITVFIESGRGYFARKMQVLEEDLIGDFRMTLYRDPLRLRELWEEALGDRFSAIDLWPLPLRVEYLLFNDSSFNASTQVLNFYFQPRFPVLAGRLLQLRGDLGEAKRIYTNNRFRDYLNVNGELVPVPPEFGDPLNVMLTYYLGLSQLDSDEPKAARDLFEQALRISPEEPIIGSIPSLMRWGAQSNLGLLYDEAGQPERALQYYGLPNPTSQHIGDQLRAASIVFDEPPFAVTAPTDSDPADRPL